MGYTMKQPALKLSYGETREQETKDLLDINLPAQDVKIPGPTKKTKSERANIKAKRKTDRANKRIKRSEKRIAKHERKLKTTTDSVVRERKQNRSDRQQGKIDSNKEKKKAIETKRVKTIIES